MLNSDWSVVQKGIVDNNPESKSIQTPSGLNTLSWTPSSELGVGRYPGVAPLTRGPYATMYAQRPWTIRQYKGFFHGGGIE